MDSLSAHWRTKTLKTNPMIEFGHSYRTYHTNSGDDNNNNNNAAQEVNSGIVTHTNTHKRMSMAICMCIYLWLLFCMKSRSYSENGEREGMLAIRKLFFFSILDRRKNYVMILKNDTSFHLFRFVFLPRPNKWIHSDDILIMHIFKIVLLSSSS